ncbi:MAG: ammonium transporter [Candidatus Hydrogenedentota bacterium]
MKVLMNDRRPKVLHAVLVLAALLLLPMAGAHAQEEDPAAAQQVMLDTMWVMIAGFLVFFMNAGFALVESGFCRAKNTVNILAKNFIVFAIASLTFWATGFALMFGDGNALVGTGGFFLSGADNSPVIEAYEGVYSAISWAGVPLEAKFFFQLVFAATAATIVSGAVAERIKFQSYILFAALLVAVMYPISGHWIWGGGWLGDIRGTFFMDFAGSTVVHSVGGWAALAGVILLGPRLGKYKKDGSINAIPGHNMALATLGGLVLWLGWFGFNPGSTMAADAGAIAHIATTTAMAAAAGVAGATAFSWLRLGNPDLSMIVNGALAGLVAITAPCDGVSITGSVIIGLIAGVLVVESVITFDKLHVDDPVGAISVHLVNGIWGTAAVGLFNTEAGLFYGGGVNQLIVQVIGIVAVGAFTFLASMVLWMVVKGLLGIRVTPEEEHLGLDQSEMGLEAYPADATTSAYSAAS